MTIIDDNESNPESLIEIEQLELDPESAVDIEDAIRDAMEAVENSSPDSASVALDSEDSASSESTGPSSPDLAAEVEELRERSMRTLADFENYRKRIQRERAEEGKYAYVPVIREFLTVVDNLERALTAEASVDNLQKGVELILQQMQDLIRRFGVSRIDAAGQMFDPNLHEAVSREEDADVEAPTVVEEFQPGYQMHDRLLRPAIVKVAMPPVSPEAGGASDATGPSPIAKVDDEGAIS